MRSKTVLLPLLLLASARIAPAQDAPDLVRNGDFEQVSVGHPEGWTLTQHGNDCSLSVAPGHRGKHAAKLSCTEFRKGWVILAQDGVVEVAKGQWYRLTFRARAEGLRGGASVALYNRKPWDNCGLVTSFEAGREWSEHEIFFRAGRDSTDTRFEFYFSTAGALLLDDVRLSRSGPPPLTDALPPKTTGNLIVNGSFELGGWLWGTEGRDSLSAEAVPGGAVGATCLRIRIDPANAEVYAVDWFEPRFWTVLGGTIGSAAWMGLPPGKPVTLSAYLRSGDAALRATLTMGEVTRGVASKTVEVGPTWQRYAVTGTPRESGCFVRIGVEIGEEPVPCELFVDGVQLEPGPAPTPFGPRSSLELGLSTDHYGNLFARGEEVSVLVQAVATEPGPVPVRVQVIDSWDRAVYETSVTLRCPAAGPARLDVALPDLPKGFFRIRATVEGRTDVLPAELRLAKVEPLHRLHAGRDGPFGINHASPADSRLEPMRMAGITWVRDWTLKWHQVQRADGAPFDFGMGDRQINRALEAGFRVMCVLPHPATPWCTTAAPDLPREGTGRQIRQTLSHMPADVAKFGLYVRACVEHFKDRAKVWEVLNEPGYLKPEEYAELLKVGYENAKAADPDCRVMGGKGAGPGNAFDWYRGLFEQGGLRWMDIVNLHPYPGSASGRAYEQRLRRFNDTMDAIDRRLPIWVTEYLYCSDDDPLPTVPASNKPCGACSNELGAGTAMVQYNIVFLCHGTEKLFQHTNHWPLRLTADTLLFSMFFDYGATPKKTFAAHNAMAWLLGPKPRFSQCVDVGEDRFCAVFRTDKGSLAVLWRGPDADEATFGVPDGATTYDMMGNALAGEVVPLTEFPVYLRSRRPAPDIAADVRRSFAGGR